MQPRSWLDRAVGACLLVLFAAIVLTIAARLLEAVWPVLAVAGVVVLGLFAVVVVIRLMYERSPYW